MESYKEACRDLCERVKKGDYDYLIPSRVESNYSLKQTESNL